MQLTVRFALLSKKKKNSALCLSSKVIQKTIGSEKLISPQAHSIAWGLWVGKLKREHYFVCVLKINQFWF